MVKLLGRLFSPTEWADLQKRMEAEAAAAAKSKSSVAGAVTGVFMGAVAKKTADRFDQLEARVAEIEQRSSKSLSYEGVWSRHRGYSEGMIVTDKGATWIAKKETRARPGEDAASWQMTAKSYRGDGR